MNRMSDRNEGGGGNERNEEKRKISEKYGRLFHDYAYL